MQCFEKQSYLLKPLLAFILLTSSSNVLATSPGVFENPVNQVKNAWDNDELLRYKVNMNYTTVFIDPIEMQVDDTSSKGVNVATIKTEDIYTVTLGVSFFPNTYNVNMSFTQSLGIEDSDSTQGNINQKEKVEEFRIDFRPSENTKIIYDRYSLNSYMNVNSGETVLLIDQTNLTARDLSVSGSDQGVSVLTGGDSSTLNIERDHLEFRYFSKNTNLLGARYYTGIFYESFTKPWSSGFEVWFESNNINNKVAAVYSQSTMKVLGISAGYEKDISELEPGFNLKQLQMNIGLLDIGLTDNYSLSTRMADQAQQQGIKLNLSSSIAHRARLSKRMEFISSAFMSYDHYLIDMGHTNTSISSSGEYSNFLKGSEISLSQDVIFGISGVLLF